MPGGFWRQYQLKASGLTCEINETYDENVLTIEGSEGTEEVDEAALEEAHHQAEMLWGSI